MPKEKRQKQSNPADELLERMMVNPDVDAKKLQVMLDMQEVRVERAAKVAFSAGMARVQEQLRVVPEDKTNNQTGSSYSSYKMLLAYVKPFYTDAGFALLFYEEDATKESEVRICVDVMHEGGYSKKYHTEIPLDDRGIKGTINKTRPHAKGSSISYGRSYLIKMLFNLSTGEADDRDGNGDTNTFGASADKQIKEIKDLRESISLSEEEFKKRLKKRFNKDCPRDLTYEEAASLIHALTMLNEQKA